MTQTLAKFQLGFIALITIGFLWATMPNPVQAKVPVICDIALRPKPPLKWNQVTPLDHTPSHLS